MTASKQNNIPSFWTRNAYVRRKEACL